MKKGIIYLSLLLAGGLFLSGCGDDEEVSTATDVQGWHFQGRDCLACHNIDLENNKHLLYGGTLYKEKVVTDQDDLNNVCGGEFVVNFLDEDFNLVVSSKDYIDPFSKGYEAKGNLFILQRKLPLLNAGNYYVYVTDTNGSIVAATSGATHRFSSQEYEISNPNDFGNRLSCNACHSNSGITDPLYANIDKTQCE
jgi:hypothetical protein